MRETLAAKPTSLIEADNMDNKQYPTSQPSRKFIPPAEKFRVPTPAERFPPIASPKARQYVRSPDRAKPLVTTRGEINRLIAKDALWRAQKATEAAALNSARIAKAAEKAARREAAKARRKSYMEGKDAFDLTPASWFVAPQTGRAEYQGKKRLRRLRSIAATERKSKVGEQPSWMAEYEQYLRSPAWREFRESVFASRGRHCQRCGNGQGSMHVHHLHYRNFRKEKPEDVLVLCEPCHVIAHA